MYRCQTVAPNKVQGNDKLGKRRSQQREHAATGGELDESLTALRSSLVIASQPQPSGDPGKAAFDHPSSGERTKPWRKQFVPLHLGADRGTSRPRWGTFGRRTMAMVQPSCSLSQLINWPP